MTLQECCAICGTPKSAHSGMNSGYHQFRAITEEPLRTCTCGHEEAFHDEGGCDFFYSVSPMQQCNCSNFRDNGAPLSYKVVAGDQITTTHDLSVAMSVFRDEIQRACELALKMKTPSECSGQVTIGGIGEITVEAQRP